MRLVGAKMFNKTSHRLAFSHHSGITVRKRLEFKIQK